MSQTDRNNLAEALRVWRLRLDDRYDLDWLDYDVLLERHSRIVEE